MTGILLVQKLNNGLVDLKCPNCGKTDFETTCIGYTGGEQNNPNRLRCQCGWTGIAKELFKKHKEWILEQYKEPNQIGERQYVQEGRDSVTKIEQAVINLILWKARHKRNNVVMGEETWDQLLFHFQKELDELVQALHYIRNEPKKNHSHVLEELGDIYGLLVHATIKAGFSMTQVEERELAKFQERFEYNEQQTTTETNPVETNAERETTIATSPTVTTRNDGAIPTEDKPAKPEANTAGLPHLGQQYTGPRPDLRSEHLQEFAPVTFHGKQVGTAYIRKDKAGELEKFFEQHGERVPDNVGQEGSFDIANLPLPIWPRAWELPLPESVRVPYLQPHTPASNWVLSSQVSENHD